MHRKYSKKKKTMVFFIALIMLAVICLPTFSISAYANTVDLSTAVNCPSNFKGVQFNDGLSNISNLTLKGLSFKKVVSIPGRPIGARYNGDVCYKLKNGNKEISLWAYYEISGSNLSTDDKAQRIIQAAYNAFHGNTNVEVSSVNIYTDYDHAPAVSDGKISMSGEGIKERLTYDPNGTFGDHVTYWMGAKSNNLNISIYKDGDGNEIFKAADLFVNAGGSVSESYTNEDGELETNVNGGDDLLDEAVARILELVFAPISMANTWFLNAMTGSMVDDFQINPRNNFIPKIASFGDATVTDAQTITFLNAFRTVALIFLAFDFLIGLFLCMTKEDNNGDNVISIITRSMIATGVIAWIYPILDELDKFFFGSGNGGILAAFLPGGVTMKIEDGALERLVQTYELQDISQAAVTLICIILQVALIIFMLKLYLEVIERWILCNVLYMAAPLAISMAPSKSTNNITRKFISSFLTQAMIMIMNVWLVQLDIILINNFDPNNPAWGENTSGGNLVYILVIIGILNVAAKIDQYLGDMGLNAIQTGQGLGNAIFGAIGTGYGMARTAAGITRKAVNGARNGTAAIGRLSGTGAANAKINAARTDGATRKDLDIVKRAQSGRAMATSTAENPYMGVAGDGIKEKMLDQIAGNKGLTLAGNDAADFYKANLESNSPDLEFKSGDGTYWDNGTKSGHVEGVMNKKGEPVAFAGTVSHRASNDAIDLGGGYYLKMDNGDKHFGGELDKNMYNGQVQDLEAYNKAHSGAFNKDTLSSIGAPKATKIRSEGNGAVTLFHTDKDGNEKVDAALSYNDKHFGGAAHRITTSDDSNKNATINGNRVYGVVSTDTERIASNETEIRAAADTFAEMLNTDPNRSQDEPGIWVTEAANKVGEYKVRNSATGGAYYVSSIVGNTSAGSGDSVITAPTWKHEENGTVTGPDHGYIVNIRKEKDTSHSDKN